MKLGIYKHYRGDLYRVIGICRHTESLEELVVYQSLHGDYGLWARPRVMFEQMIEVDGSQVSRFEYQQDCFTAAPKAR